MVKKIKVKFGTQKTPPVSTPFDSDMNSTLTIISAFFVRMKPSMRSYSPQTKERKLIGIFTIPIASNILTLGANNFYSDYVPCTSQRPSSRRTRKRTKRRFRMFRPYLPPGRTSSVTTVVPRVVLASSVQKPNVSELIIRLARHRRVSWSKMYC